MATFKELLNASMKSEDTEEWLDVHFTRPIGLLFALGWIKLGVHPNAVTLLSIVLGGGAGVMFSFEPLTYNIVGVCLLMLANFCDSTDGQMARLTGKKTLIGRILDGFSGDVWFFAIYVGLCIRLQGQFMPATDVVWSGGIWVLATIAGLLCHSPQSSLADYYRQIHLFFLLGKKGSELDDYAGQRATYEALPKEQWLARLFFFNYANYCKSQEKRTPKFQRFFALWKERQAAGDDLETLRRQFLQESRPLMKFTNLLTFNSRAICLYVTCLLNVPYLYFIFEIVVLGSLYVYMHKRHESVCEALYVRLKNNVETAQKENV